MGGGERAQKKGIRKEGREKKIKFQGQMEKSQDNKDAKSGSFIKDIQGIICPGNQNISRVIAPIVPSSS